MLLSHSLIDRRSEERGEPGPLAFLGRLCVFKGILGTLDTNGVKPRPHLMLDGKSSGGEMPICRAGVSWKL